MQPGAGPTSRRSDCGTCGQKRLHESLTHGIEIHLMRGRRDDHSRVLGDTFTRENFGCLPEIIDFAIGARTNKYLIDLHTLDVADGHNVTGKEWFGHEGLQ